VTPQLRDRQVLNAVLRVFRDSGRPRALRLAALEALMGYYQPGLSVKYVEPIKSVKHGSAYVMVGRGEGATTTSRTSPLTPASRKEILLTLQQAGAGDRDERVRQISAYIHDRLVAIP
jgi:hypothetical protein